MSMKLIVVPLLALALVCVDALIAEAKTTPQRTVEDTVRTFFEDTPVMIDIARCESKFRQFNTDGSVLRGGWGGGMVGVYQFYERIHAAAALALGFDLSTLEGNLGYAKHVYITQGTAPWDSAKACWQEKTVQSGYQQTDVVALQKKVDELTKLLAQLQRLLAEKRALSGSV